MLLKLTHFPGFKKIAGVDNTVHALKYGLGSLDLPVRVNAFLSKKGMMIRCNSKVSMNCL